MNATIQNQLSTEELQPALAQNIRTFVKESPDNRLRDIDDSPIWGEPLVGFADGDDPLFDKFKEVVSEAYLSPREWMRACFSAIPGKENEVPAGIGVVSWILPATQKTRLDNRIMTAGPSLRWNHTRFQGEEFNDDLRRFVTSWLKERGIDSIAPVLSDQFTIHRSSCGRASTWSERHAAFAAGLGTFGLSDGLITARGIAHRCGSVIAGVKWAADKRPYTSHTEYCTFYKDGSCGVCIQRCSAGAITAEGHDKDKCHTFLYDTLAEWIKKPGFIGSYGACGLCQTKTPCESQIPDR